MYTRRISNCLGGLKTYSTSNCLGNITTTTLGNVGIGITAPSSLLHVNGILTVPTIATTNLLSTNNSLTNLIITNLSNGNNTCVFNSTNFQNNTAGTIRSINLNFSASTTNNFISTNSSINNAVITNISASSCTTNNLIANNITVGNIKGVGAVPTGVVLMWSNETAPDGFLLCDGSSVLISSWENLFGVIGYTFGGDTAGNFNLPDFKGRIPVGLGTTISTGTLGLKGGSETHTLNINQIPSHNHGPGETSYILNHDHSLAYNLTDLSSTPSSTGSFAVSRSSFDEPNQISTTLSGSHSHSFTTGNIGSNIPHENMQSFIVINYIIKT